MSPTVRWYRVVSLPEVRDLEATGRFRCHQSAEGKYFWEREQDAERFGVLTAGHYHPEGFRIVAADLLFETAQAAYRWPMLDGVGAARFVPEAHLTSCSVIFLPTP